MFSLKDECQHKLIGYFQNLAFSFSSGATWSKGPEGLMDGKRRQKEKHTKNALHVEHSSMKRREWNMRRRISRFVASIQ